MSNVPQDLKYTKSDEWIRVEGNIGIIGITDYAQDALNDIVYVEFPDVDDDLDQGGVFGSVESVKAASDLKSPVAGTVKEVNEKLEDEPETVNSEPYGDGWFIKIEISDASQLDALMDAAAYIKHLEDRD